MNVSPKDTCVLRSSAILSPRPSTRLQRSEIGAKLLGLAVDLHGEAVKTGISRFVEEAQLVFLGFRDPRLLENLFSALSPDLVDMQPSLALLLGRHAARLQRDDVGIATLRRLGGAGRRKGLRRMWRGGR